MLINSSQIEFNLRRTARKGYISILNQEQLEFLALKYFGIKDEDGNIIGYQCPYSGEIYTEYRNIVLEHIIPIDSKGGTVLFNCIPTSSEVNKTNEKGAKHLITWWTNSKYWDTNATLRLEKLVNYMLEAYERVFEEHTLEELETSYLDFDLSEEITINNNLELSEQQESLILKKQGEQNGIHSYLGFILSCIETLEKYNVNTIEIRSKLKDLENKHIFENIDRFQLFQNILQQVIISRLGDDNRSYLTYLLKFDIKKLIDSIEYQNQDEIYNELDLRLKNIENILKENNLSIIEYFKSANYITDIDIVYKNINSITEDDKVIFSENIKLGIDSKINIFIEMLNKGNSNILIDGNKETLEGYPSIKLANFWYANNNRDKIKKKLFEDLKNNPEYNVARKIVDNWVVDTNIDKKIEIFIEMLNKGNSNILTNGNKETLEGYPNIPLVRFWHMSNNRTKIMQKLFVELKDNPEYNVARKIIDNWLVYNDLDKKIEIFIEMLNKGNSNILTRGNKETLEGYPSVPLAYFWSKYREEIKKKLFEDLKDNPEYNVARKIVDNWLVENDLDKRIEIFIEMLNKGNSNILNSGNNERLEGYPNIKLTYFWYANNNRDKIKKKLFEDLKDNPEYNLARKIVDNWLFENDLDKKLDMFIDMLNKENSNILIEGNKETLEGYPNIPLAYFWRNYRDKIMRKLFEDLKDNPEYNVARKIVDNWLVDTDLDKKIEIFIEMLNKGKSNILTQGNKETLEGYSNIKLTYFWNNNREKIMQKLFEDLKDNQEYNLARKIVDNWLFENDLDKRIEIFISMLNKGNSNILTQRNKETLEGYPSITLDHFWSNSSNRGKIIQKLFEDLKDNPEYNVARKIVDNWLVENDLDKKLDMFIDMLNKENSNILIEGNKENLEGYPNIPLAYFWGDYKDKIMRKLFEDLKNNKEYDRARRIVENWFFRNNTESKIEVFIKMLNKGNVNILVAKNNEVFEGYEEFQVGNFWFNNKDLIIKKLFEDLKDNKEYDVARQIINQSVFKNDINQKIKVFINMLNKGNTNILKQKNNEVFEGYEEIKVGQFWSTNRNLIIQKLFIDLKDNLNYNIARQTVLTYLKVSSYEEYLEKERKSKELKELKKIKKQLESVDETLTRKENVASRKGA